MEQKKFYQKNWFMWVLLLFLPPIGIIFIWLTRKDLKGIKLILLTGFGLIWGIYVAFSGNGAGSNKPDPEPNRYVAVENIETSEATTTRATTTEATTKELATTEITTTEAPSTEATTEITTTEITTTEATATEATTEITTEAPATEDSVAPASVTVYTTATGKKYHSTSSCKGLRRAKNIYEHTETEAINSGLSKCDLCW